MSRWKLVNRLSGSMQGCDEREEKDGQEHKVGRNVRSQKMNRKILW